MPDKWTDRQERVYQEMVDRLKFWGYAVPAGEKQTDPALLLMLKAFAFHTTVTEDRLKRGGDDVIDTLISSFFLTGIKRPVPAFTMVSCRCSDKRAVIDSDIEFSCSIGGAERREYSFHPLFSQEIIDIDADIVLFTSGEYFRVLRTLSDEARKWEEGLDSPAYRNMQRQSPPPLGGTIYVGITINLPVEEVSGIPLYLGPDRDAGQMLKWVEWATLGEQGAAEKFTPGRYDESLEIYRHLDIREFELDTHFQSRLYSSDLLTSGRNLWFYKHYLAPALNFAYIPGDKLVAAERMIIPTPLQKKFSHINFSGLKTPRLWLRISLRPDEPVVDLRKLRYFDSNTLLLINRRREHRNKYTMGQPVLEVNLFDLFERESADKLRKLFTIDRVWDSREDEYANYLDLTAHGNPRKYMVVEEDGGVKVKFNFQPSGKQPPDFVVVEYSLTEGNDANGIGADVELSLVNDHPQLHSPRNLVTSSGGSDAKSDEELRRLTGFFLRSHGVALSESEIEFLARNFDTRIVKAKAHRSVVPTAGGLLPAVVVDVQLQPDLKVTPEEQTYLLQRLSAYLNCYTPINLHLTARMATG